MSNCLNSRRVAHVRKKLLFISESFIAGYFEDHEYQFRVFPVYKIHNQLNTSTASSALWKIPSFPTKNPAIAMAEGQDASQNIITVTVKAPKQKEYIEIGENADIKEVIIFHPYVPHTLTCVRDWNTHTYMYTIRGGTMGGKLSNR